jgi:predicted aspartyl protease
MRLAPADAADESCALMKFAGIDLEYDVVGRPIVPVLLNGHRRYLIVDTGGVYSVLDSSTADALGLRSARAGTSVIGVTGERTNRYFIVEEFVVGELRADDRTFMVSPLGPGADNEIWPAGTIGADVLSAFDVDFDFGNGTLNLFSQDHCEGQVIYWHPERVAIIPFELSSSNHVMFPVALDGVELTAMMDTGAHSTIVNRDVAERRLNVDIEAEGLTPVGTLGNDGDLVYRRKFQSLTMDGIMIETPMVRIMPDLMNSDLNRFLGLSSGSALPDVIIGMSVLSNLHVYIAYGEERLYITEASAAPSQ